VGLDGGDGLPEECGDLLGQHGLLVAEDDGDAEDLGEGQEKILDARLEADIGFAGDVGVVLFEPLLGR
jgi:hypothetical protein